MRKQSLKSMRESALYLSGLILHGNNKLLDYDDDENGVRYRYAQWNTRAVIDCPFASAGCKAVCYATKGNHVFPSVKQSRERSTEQTRRADFADAMVYTIETEQKSKRYAGNVMIVRIHESGDFYSVQYLRKWIEVWNRLEHNDGVRFVFYTKSFPFLLKLNDAEADIVNRCLASGRLSINLSIDDTTTTAQRVAYLACIARFPLVNTYRVTEHTDGLKEDDVCTCANCAKCGACNRSTGREKVVAIHSASKTDIDVYNANKAEA